MNGLWRLLTKPVAIVVLVAGAAAVGFGMYWFQPWKLWVDETVHEDLPTAAGTPGQERGQDAAQDAGQGSGGGTEADGASPSPSPTEPAGPAELATGEFITHEHDTTGTVRILRLEDGSVVLRLEDLDTSNGPDLHVWLTDAPVIEGRDGWGVFDDGQYLSAGKLKGNKGDQNYPLPEDTGLDAYTSVSIWCDRFNVSFGAAELAWTTGA
ncbi:DM13 domain-containing protein [Streptomyces sp. YIM 98790]|uniref:DM13 domain-containing protein n=1 Tax=Streptomyces sp. YIM 98790 TaxID=2689077 RepID=UPI00140B7B2B|nr:DM13 domain-containing protein [Streptomyces sp. YIM 98790]